MHLNSKQARYPHHQDASAGQFRLVTLHSSSDVADTRRDWQNIENFEAQKEDDRNEDELIKAVKPLIEQAEKVRVFAAHRLRYFR